MRFPQGNLHHEHFCFCQRHDCFQTFIRKVMVAQTVKNDKRPMFRIAMRGGAQEELKRARQRRWRVVKIRANHHESLDQLKGRTNQNARPPVLTARSQTSSTVHRQTTNPDPWPMESQSVKGQSCWATRKTSKANLQSKNHEFIHRR